MSATATVSRLRRLAEDWRREESRLCKQFGDVIAPQSMRARRIKDTKAIDAAVEMIERLEDSEQEKERLLGLAHDQNRELVRLREECRALRAENDRMDEAMESLLIRCDDSDSAMYGTLSTSFVRDTVRIARAALEESK